MVVTFPIASECYFPTAPALLPSRLLRCCRQVRVLPVLIVPKPFNGTIVALFAHFDIHSGVADVAEVPGGYVLYKEQQYGIAFLSPGGEYL